ncbi:pilus (MSHA type) biogenesis protein MshL [Halorhodospira neutriphila]|nr:pilus (MSHA type) biogenesis protein MshL [Halorhodospira neutriphila]
MRRAAFLSPVALLPLLSACGTMQEKPEPSAEAEINSVPGSAYERLLEDPDLAPERPEAEAPAGAEGGASGAAGPLRLGAEQRLPMISQAAEGGAPEEVSGQRYSFRADALPVGEALRMFGRMYDLNVYTDPDVTGTVDVDFADVPLEQAMRLLLSGNGLYWAWDDGVIHVQRTVTRTFELDYVRMSREGSFSSSASVEGSGGSGGGDSSGDAEISQSVTNEFWDEIEEQLGSLLSGEGRLVVNRMTGTVQVSDVYPRVQDVEQFVASLQDAMGRQVAIEARILEVKLRDDQAMGIDWSRINLDNFGQITSQTSFTGGGGSASPAGVDGAAASTLTIDFNDGSFSSLVSALKEQGDVRVMSQPRVRTLNNQPAVIKVATQQTFWERNTTRFVEDGEDIVEVDESANNFSEGLMLSVTPQISDDGRVMLDVSPMITDLVDVSQSPSGDSNAPIFDVKQTSTLVQVSDGETVLIGGLIQDGTSKSRRGIPVLGSLPLLGRLFSSDYEAKSRTELVIFIEPTVIGRRL